MSHFVDATDLRRDPPRDPRGASAWTLTAPSREALLAATCDAGDDSYTALRAIRDAGEIVDWVIIDANALVQQRWATIVGDVIGQRLSILNSAANNGPFDRHFEAALATGMRQVFVEELVLPEGEGGWRRTTVIPVDHDTITVTTRNISREVYLERALDQERRALGVPARGDAPATCHGSILDTEARFLARTATALFAGAGLITIANSYVPAPPGVDAHALRITGALSVVAAVLVRLLPWHRHARTIAAGLISGAIAFLVVSDRFDHYSQHPASMAVFPVFFIIIVTWTGLLQRRGLCVIVAAASGLALAELFSSSGHGQVGLQCVIVTMPAAAVLGEVLCWSYSKTAELARLEANRRLHDPLTNLANRQLFIEQLDHALARQRRTGKALAVLFVDLDRFKQVNDSFGHDAGDELLLEAATRLRGAIRENDLVARLGGDEFAVLCEDLDEQADAVKAVRRILASFERPLTCAKRELYVTASIGVSFATNGSEAPADLLRDADAAMYRAKRNGRNRFEIFDEKMRHLVAHRLELASALRHGIEHDELRVHYQPIYDRDAETVRQYEALVRWERPGYGLLMPGEFIDVAEESGAIFALGEWVLTEACRQASRLAALWPERHLGVAVNVASRQLLEGGFVDVVKRVLEAAGLDPSLLTLELTETTLIDDAVSAQTIVKELQDLGVKVALDDFGTGYSSLTYLRTFPINTIKVDGSFVRTIGQERQGAAIVTAVVALAQSLGITVVAEGIETRSQLEAVVGLGCDLLQGFVLSEPRPIEEIMAALGGQAASKAL